MAELEPAFRCQGRNQNPATAFIELPQDYWRVAGNDRCCSYCGSWHWDEFKAFLLDAADSDKPNCYVTESTKRHKLYIHRSDVKNAAEGAIKMYGWHIPEEIEGEIEKLFREALEVSFRKMMARLDLVCLDAGMGESL